MRKLDEETRRERFNLHRYGVLCDWSIREAVRTGLLVIEPFNPDHVQPASYDLALAQDIALGPGDCALASTIERVVLPDCIVGEVSTRSSVGRLYVAAHSQAGFIDPGFPRDITLELINHSRKWQDFKRGDRLCQIKFTWTDQPCEKPYNGRYANQSGPTDSLFEHGDQ